MTKGLIEPPVALKRRGQKGRESLVRQNVPGRFRFTEHTSDIGIEIKAADWQGFFITAANAVKELILKKLPPSGRIASRRTIHLKADNMEQLLILWINEVSFWIQNKMFVPEICELKVDPKARTLAGVACGFTAERLPCSLEVKAATYYGLKIQQKNGCLEATVILDV